MAITLRGDGDTTFDNNIGIGTTSPDEALHVHATGSTQIAAEFEASNNETYIQFTGNDSTQVLYGRDSADACIQVNASDVFKAKSGGNCEIVDGNLQVASGHGIDFAGTGGTTPASTLLDDYEEGTWSPVPQGATTAGSVTAGTVVGQYIKIGKMVFATLRAEGATFSGSSGILRFSGLPFTAANVTAYACAAWGMTYYASFDNTRNQAWYANPSTNYIYAIESRSGNTWVSMPSSNLHTSNLYVQQTIVYEASA